MRTLVLDTNVLLADPDVVFAFSDARVVIPETVLGELDKVKTSRVDPDLRFRGREVSRYLFEISEGGSLTEGAELPEGGILQVVPLDPDAELPEGLSGRNADDRILAVAHGIWKGGAEDLTLVTNDLNMLLKAQTLGVPVERYADGVESSFGRRYIVRPFQRYKIPLAILAMSLAVFAAIVVLTLLSGGGSDSASGGVPSEFRAVLSEQQERILDLLVRLESNPTDLDAQLDLAGEYFSLRDHTGDPGHAELARHYYELYLQSRPEDASARTDLAITYWRLGRTDDAIQEVATVLQSDPTDVSANFNLGIFYWRGRGDFASAATQFRNVIDLTEGSADPEDIQAHELATTSLALLEEEAEAAGQPLPDAGGT